MKARHLLALMSALALASGCHLNLLLEGEGYACNADDNCPQGLHCVQGACVASAGDAGVTDTATASDAQPPDSAAPADSAAHADTAAPPDTTVPADTAAPVDSTAGADTTTATDAAPLDSASAVDGSTPVDAAPQDAGSPCDSPAVSTVASGLTNPARLILFNGALYWTGFATNGPVMKHVLSSRTTLLIGNLTGDYKPYGLAADGSHVYVLAEGGVGAEDAVYRFADAPSSPPELVADGIGLYSSPLADKAASNIFVNAGKVYWLAQGSAFSANVCRHDPAQQAANVFDRAKTRSGGPLGIVRFGADLFVAEPRTVTGMTRHPLSFLDQDSGTPVSAFAADITDLCANSSLIFLATVAPSATAPGSILTVNPQSTVLDTLEAEVGPSNKGIEVLAMAADDSTLYFATAAGVGVSAQIHRRVLAEGTSTALAPAEYPVGLAIDDDWIYWTEYVQNAIKKYPRCP